MEGLSLYMSSLVDIRDYVNKELALRIHTAIDSQGTFFTDLNGFQVIAGPRALETPQRRTWIVFCLCHRHQGVVCSDREGRIRREWLGRDFFRFGIPWGPSMCV